MLVQNNKSEILKIAKIILKITLPDYGNLGVVEQWSVGVNDNFIQPFGLNMSFFEYRHPGVAYGKPFPDKKAWRYPQKTSRTESSVIF